MLLRRRFGQTPTVAAIFAAGVATGWLLGPMAPGRPATANAAAPGRPLPATLAWPRYPVDVIRVIDGDTFDARVRAWPGIEITTKVRLRNIDAPEMRARCEQEAALARAAREALVAMLAQAPVAIAEVGLDKYGGRVLAQASAGGIQDVSAALLEAGLVRRYTGGRREGWCAAH
jgi:endonuclease YncB( thermonuclease family)